MTPEKKFWSRVIKTDGCWKWSGAKHRFGYGLMRNDAGTRETASRFSWALHNGAIPDGMHVCHKCDNPECTNPEHLFLGTARDNAVDKEEKGRGIRKLTQTECDAVATLLGSGVAKRLIARAFQIDRNGITTALSYGVVHRPPPYVRTKPRLPPSPPPILRGEDNFKAKLTEQDVIQIRRLRASGMSTGDIAKQFVVGKSMVSHICTRRSWKHVA